MLAIKVNGEDYLVCYLLLFCQPCSGFIFVLINYGISEMYWLQALAVENFNCHPLERNVLIELSKLVQAKLFVELEFVLSQGCSKCLSF